MDPDPTDYAILSTTEQELLVREASSWGDALAQYVEEIGLSPESLLGCVDHTPHTHYTVDLYDEHGREETVIVMELEDLEVDDPKFFPAE